jgi:flavin-dependent dehydrogenase
MIRSTQLSAADIFDVAIAGAGPAGSSMAIRLALAGARVLLVEEKKFPRSKLCGEFISPECLTHFKNLGVMAQLRAAGGVLLAETVFYSRRGRSLSVPSEWFKPGSAALGLSRREMDQQLLARARAVGVVVLEESHASQLVTDPATVCGLRVKAGSSTRAYRALVTVDATGRTRALARHLDPPRGPRRKNVQPMVAFKAHLANARLAPDTCEIYFYERGYGGLSSVEGGLSNLCFMVAARDVRRYGSDPELVLRKLVQKNVRARYTLAEARAVSPWLSVSLDSFGSRTLTPARGLLTVGDAASFIDPFTGSGMLLALESGALAAETIRQHLSRLRQGSGFEIMAGAYEAEYRRRFQTRLRVSGLLRRAAFVPRLDEAAILFLGSSASLGRKLARATRHSARREVRVTNR